MESETLALMGKILDYGMSIALLVGLNIFQYRRHLNQEKDTKALREKIIKMAGVRADNIPKMTKAFQHLDQLFSSKLDKVGTDVKNLVVKLEQ